MNAPCPLALPKRGKLNKPKGNDRAIIAKFG